MHSNLIKHFLTTNYFNKKKTYFKIITCSIARLHAENGDGAKVRVGARVDQTVDVEKAARGVANRLGQRGRGRRRGRRRHGLINDGRDHVVDVELFGAVGGGAVRRLLIFGLFARLVRCLRLLDVGVGLLLLLLSLLRLLLGPFVQGLFAAVVDERVYGSTDVVVEVLEHFGYVGVRLVHDHLFDLFHFFRVLVGGGAARAVRMIAV